MSEFMSLAEATHRRGSGLSSSLVALVAAICTIAGPASAAESEPQRFSVFIFEGAPGARQIESGAYALAERVARGLSGPSTVERFEAETHVCVANLMSGDLDAALASCDQAVRAAGERDASPLTAGRSSGAARRERLAIAHTNRGVVHALRGEMKAAARDLERGVELAPDQSESRRNLARLDQATTLAKSE